VLTTDAIQHGTGAARSAANACAAHGPRTDPLTSRWHTAGWGVAHGSGYNELRSTSCAVAWCLLDRGVIPDSEPRESFEHPSSAQRIDAPSRHTRASEVVVFTAAGLLGLCLGVWGCGGQSGRVGTSTGASGSTSVDSANASHSPPDDLASVQSAPTLRAEQFDAAVVTDPNTVERADTSGAAWRVIEVPGASNLPSIVHTPSGWLALSRRFLGDSKAPSGVESALYRSKNGVHWQSLPLDPTSDDLFLRDLAYGAGHYVMVGERRGGGGIIWTSSDGESWIESSQSLTGPYAWSTVIFVRDLFFAFGHLQLAVSRTGESWEALPTRLVQHVAGAYGNGRYLLLGNGPMQTSEDGRTWQEHLLECSLPGACNTSPSGGVGQGSHYFALFAEGRFFTEELSSPDGVTWEAQPGLSPIAYIGGRFVGISSQSVGLAAWTLGGPARRLRTIRPSRDAVTEAGRDWIGVLDRDAPLPETVDVPFEDGLTCENADCVLVGGTLFLVPPPGTPPLVDRVPRDVDGEPLLTHDCPVSSMLFCDDYTARSGCFCDTGAPRNPEYCEDVSHYGCANRFVARPDEWQLDEVAQAGCRCDAIDPNQPLGFGLTCSAGDTTCPAPLECLGVDPDPSPLPSPQPFICTSRCTVDADCPSWVASGFCSGQVNLHCSGGTCQPRTCH
jgi:hypothetical protein